MSFHHSIRCASVSIEHRRQSSNRGYVNDLMHALPSLKSSRLSCHHYAAIIHTLIFTKLLCSFKGCEERRQFLSNACTLSQQSNCGCQNIVCVLVTGGSTYSLSCYTLHKHPYRGWVTNCLLSSPFSAHQPRVAPTLVCDIGYLIGELIVAAVFAMYMRVCQIWVRHCL